MTVVIQNVGRVRAVAEGQGPTLFCVEQDIANFLDVGVIEGSTTLVMDRPFESPKILQTLIDQQPLRVIMPRQAKFDFAMCMRGAGDRAASGLTMDSTLLGGIRFPLKVMFGGEFLGTGTTIASTSTTTVLNVTSAAGLREGGALAVPTGAGGALECREIKTIATNAVTLHLALSSAPAVSTVVYGCATYYPDASTGDTTDSLQLTAEGLSTTDRWLLKGGQIASPPTLDLAPGSIPKLSLSWMFADHKAANGTETTMNLNSAFTDTAPSPAGTNSVLDGEFRIRQVSSSVLSGTDVHAPEIQYRPNLAYIPHRTPGGTNTIKQWVRNRVEDTACRLEFTIPWEGTTWRQRRDGGTNLAMTYQIGSSVANGGFMVTMPASLVDDVQRVDVSGIAGQRVRMFARSDSTTTTNSNALQKAAMRIHLF